MNIFGGGGGAELITKFFLKLFVWFGRAFQKCCCGCKELKMQKMQLQKKVSQIDPPNAQLAILPLVEIDDMNKVF